MDNLNRSEHELPTLAIAGIAFFAGLAIGSKRTERIFRTGIELARDTGNLLLGYATEAFEKARKVS